MSGFYDSVSNNEVSTSNKTLAKWSNPFIVENDGFLENTVNGAPITQISSKKMKK